MKPLQADVSGLLGRFWLGAKLEREARKGTRKRGRPAVYDASAHR
jgi:hypothetical protein